MSPDGGISADGGDAQAPGDGTVVELPTTAIITPHPLRVTQGFATCPQVSVGFADGHSESLILDPDYRLHVSGSAVLAHEGFTLAWVSPDGLTGQTQYSDCSAAITGLQAGTGRISLEAHGPDGSVHVIGTTDVVVDPTPGNLHFDPVGFRVVDDAISWTYLRPETVASSVHNPIPLGETRDLWPIIGGDTTDTMTRVIPENLTVTVADPSVLAVRPHLRLEGIAPGGTQLTISYLATGHLVGPVQMQVWVAASDETLGVGIGILRDDDGFVLPEGSRFGGSMPVGQCFVADAFDMARGTEPGASAPSSFVRRSTMDATWSAAGEGLTASPGQPNRFCATAPGDAAVRACRGDVCGTLGMVVFAPPAPNATTLQANMVPRVSTGSTMPPVGCFDLQLTALWPDGTSRDVSNSPALMFAPPFELHDFPAAVQFDPTTGLARRDAPGRICARLQSGPNALRVFWGLTQVEIPIAAGP